MKRIYVNEEYCLGCRLCETYCKFANSGEDDIVKAFKREGSKLTPRIRIEEDKDINFAVNCRHCTDPLCVKSCITGAMTIGPDGVISNNTDKCVGCWTCIMACPYGAVVRGELEQKVALKCELCTKNGIEPACVTHCPNRAIVFEERG